jgi:HEPN domain-containing protein
MAPGRNRIRYSDSRRYCEWMDHSFEDLETAKLLLGADGPLDTAAFHCQQCIEKALKAYMLYKINAHLDGHNLTWLCRQAVKEDKRFSEWLDESAALNRYYIETRYPSDTPLALTRGGVELLYSMAQRMYGFICSEVGMLPGEAGAAETEEQKNTQ